MRALRAQAWLCAALGAQGTCCMGRALNLQLQKGSSRCLHGPSKQEGIRKD